MTWPRQVLYLLWRDIVRLAPVLCAFCAILAVAVARAVESPVMTAGAVPSSVAVVLCLAFVISISVMADSPTRDDAFWATQPIDSKALVVSKLLVVLLFVALCVAASSFVLNAWRYPMSSLGLVAGASLVALMLFGLGGALITSACTTLTAAGLVIGSLLIVVLMFGGSALAAPKLDAAVWVPSALLLLAVGVMALLRMYRRRPTRALWKGVVMAVGAVSLLFSSLTRPVTSSAATQPRGDADGVSLRMLLSGQPDCGRGSIVIPLEVSSPGWMRVELTQPRASLVLIGGDSVNVVNSEWMQSAGVWGPLVPAPLFRATVNDEAATSARRTRRADIVFSLPRMPHRSVCGRIARIALRLDARSATGIEVMRLPLRAGAAVSAPGIRARIIDIGQRNSAVTLTARISALSSAQRVRQSDVEELEFALLQPQSGTVIRLNNQAVDEWASTADLPGLSRVWGTQRLELHRYDSGSLNASETWRGSAQLVVTAAVWRARSQRMVSAVLPPPVSVAAAAAPPFARQ